MNYNDVKDKKDKKRASFSEIKKPSSLIVSDFKSKSFQYSKDISEFSKIRKEEEDEKPLEKVSENQDIKLKLNYEHKYIGILKYQADHRKVDNMRSLKRYIC